MLKFEISQNKFAREINNITFALPFWKSVQKTRQIGKKGFSVFHKDFFGDLGFKITFAALFLKKDGDVKKGWNKRPKRESKK